MSKRVTQILVILLIVIAAAGIYAVKNPRSGASVDTSTAVTSQPGGSVSDTMPLNITNVDLSALKAKGVPFMIDFGSESCYWCQKLEPTLETLHDEWAGKATVVYVDIEKYPDAAKGFRLSAYPTQAFFNADGTAYQPSTELNSLGFTTYTENGQSYTLHVGYLEERELRAIFAEMGLKQV